MSQCLIPGLLEDDFIMEDYNEYLEQLVVEVEGKIGTMPACLRNPIKNEQMAGFIGHKTLPATPRMSDVIDESDEIPYDDGGLSETLSDSGGLIGTLSDDGGLSDTLSDNGGLTDTLSDDGGLVDTDDLSMVEKDNISIDVSAEQLKRDEVQTDVNDNIKELSSQEEVTGDRMTWRDRLNKNYNVLKESMTELRRLDIDITRQLLSVNDSIEELKWLNENYELYESKDSLNVSSKSLSRYDSREQLHERWKSERRQLASSRTNLHAMSLSNLSHSLSILNQNNNSNGPACIGDHDSMPSILSTDVNFPIIADDIFEYHPRSMSTSCAEKSTEYLKYTPPHLVGKRVISPVTSTPKSEKTREVSNTDTSPELQADDSPISRVKLESTGSQVRWCYKQTSSRKEEVAEEEVYF